MSWKPQLILRPSPMIRRQNQSSESLVRDEANAKVTWKIRLYLLAVGILSKGRSQMCMLKPYDRDAIDKQAYIAIDHAFIPRQYTPAKALGRRKSGEKVLTQAKKMRTSSAPSVRVIQPRV